MRPKADPSQPRWFEPSLLLAVAVTYAIALWDAASWAWLPLLVPVVVFVLHIVSDRVPAWLALAVTTVVVVALNVDLHAEGGFFLICLGAFVTGSVAERWVPDRFVLLAAVVAPVVDAAAGSEAVRDWNWPFWSMGVLTCWAFGAVLLHQRELTTSLRLAEARLAEQAAGEQRRRIARDVHDLVGHSLTVVLLHLTGARRLVRTDPDEAEIALSEAERVGRESLGEIRRTVALLREGNDGLDPSPRAHDIVNLIERSRAAGMQVDATLAPETSQLDAPTGLALYRIVQESLANVARHAAGSRTKVTVEVGDEAVIAEIDNSGGGLAVTQYSTQGTGIIGMRERATALDGTLVAGPTERGWRVRVELPLMDRGAEVDA